MLREGLKGNKYINSNLWLFICISDVDYEREKRQSSFQICTSYRIYCTYTSLWEDGHKCYHFVYNLEWQPHYISYRCADWSVHEIERS